VDLKQLTALVTVAEVGSITKAARLLHLVQPSVTRQIRLLEDELGVSLFHRTASGMTLTPEGSLLVDRARRVLQELDRARAEIRPAKEGLAGLVTLGMLESVAEILAEPVMSGLAIRHPGINLRLVTAYSGHLQQWLDVGDVDLSLLYNLGSSSALAVVPLLEEELWAVAPRAGGLSPDSPIALDAVLSHPLVLPISGHGLRALIDEARSTIDATPHIAVEVNSMHLQKTLVQAGHGWTVLPAGISRDVDRGLFSAAPLCNPDVTRKVVLGLQRTGRTSGPVQAVAAEVVHAVRRLVSSGVWTGATLCAALDDQ
jgi:LysR family nitrogen assimilation transcriptional regulator